MPSEQQDAPLATLTMRIVGKLRDSEIIPRGCSGFATVGPANLNFFRHQVAGLIARTRTSRGTPSSVTVCWKTEHIK
jgi:hypothetical protein